MNKVLSVNLFVPIANPFIVCPNISGICQFDAHINVHFFYIQKINKEICQKKVKICNAGVHPVPGEP